MKKVVLLFAIFAFHISLFTSVKAGGLMTNTNYHIAFDRMMARGASFDIDAAYSNPAGLAWGHEGWALSFNVQKPFQYRNIEATLTKAEPTSGYPYSALVGYEIKSLRARLRPTPSFLHFLQRISTTNGLSR